MGTFGPGNFDNDAALDVRDAACGVVDTELGGFAGADELDVEELEQVVACVAIKIAQVRSFAMELY